MTGGGIHMCKLYSDTLGMQSPLGIQPLINDLDIATLMDPQEKPIATHKILLLYVAVSYNYDTCISLICTVSIPIYT